MTACDWSSPGHNPYSGKAEAAIMAFAEIPVATRQALIARSRDDFDDVAYIDRDSIHGRNSYAPEIRSMHFGSKGQMCSTVTRNWTPEHVETALVYCQDGYCIAKPAVCGNWFILTRLDDAAPYVTAGYLTTPVAPPVYGGQLVSVPGVPAYPTNDAPEAYGYAVGGFYGGWGYVGSYCYCCGAVGVVPAVPEPGTWALLLAGGALILLVRR